MQKVVVVFLFAIISLNVDYQYIRLHNQSLELKAGLTHHLYPQFGIGMNRGVLNMGVGYTGYIERENLLTANVGINFRDLPWRKRTHAQMPNQSY